MSLFQLIEIYITSIRLNNIELIKNIYKIIHKILISIVKYLMYMVFFRNKHKCVLNVYTLKEAF
jgi:hypothetical protein